MCERVRATTAPSAANGVSCGRARVRRIGSRAEPRFRAHRPAARRYGPALCKPAPTHHASAGYCAETPHVPSAWQFRFLTNTGSQPPSGPCGRSTQHCSPGWSQFAAKCVGDSFGFGLHVLETKSQPYGAQQPDWVVQVWPTSLQLAPKILMHLPLAASLGCGRTPLDRAQSSPVPHIGP